MLSASRHVGRPRGWSRVWRMIAASLSALLSLVVPDECAVCRAPDHVLCPPCVRALRSATASPSRSEQHAPALVEHDGTVLVAAVAGGAYRGELAQAVLAYKRQGAPVLRSELAAALGRALRAAIGHSTTRATEVWLVPVPTSTAAYVRRGFDPLGDLLSRLERHRLLPPGTRVVRVLARRRRRAGELLRSTVAAVRGGGGQKGLGSGQRRARLVGSLIARDTASPWRGNGSRRLTGRPVIIVDDVLTTGSTVREAARALESAGAIVLGAAVVATVRRPGGDATNVLQSDMK